MLIAVTQWQCKRGWRVAILSMVMMIMGWCGTHDDDDDDGDDDDD